MRYEYDKDYTNNCITICDEEEELKTSFDSDICLYPMEDAITVVNELNCKEEVIKALRQQLSSYLDDGDIDYLVNETIEDFMDEVV